MTEYQKFDWNDQDGKESTIIPAVEAVAVYENASGEIAIRQQGYGDNDHIVVISKHHVKVLVKRLQELAKAK